MNDDNAQNAGGNNTPAEVDAEAGLSISQRAMASRPASQGRDRTPKPPAAPYVCSPEIRARIEEHGELVQHAPYHWQVRSRGSSPADRGMIADWWPHKDAFRFAGAKAEAGDKEVFLEELAAYSLRAKAEADHIAAEMAK